MARPDVALPAAALAMGLGLCAWLTDGVATASAPPVTPAPLLAEPWASAEPMGPPEPEPALERPEPAEAEPAAAELAPELQVIEGEVSERSTLFSSLAAQGVPAALAQRIGEEMKPVFDFRRARAGHRYRLLLRSDGSLHAFHYRTSPVERYRLRAEAEDVWVADRVEVPLERRQARLAGVVTTSLYDAVAQLGESPQLASDLAEIFAWDVDFTHAVQLGDEFRLLYERLYVLDELTGEEFYVGPGRVLAARYQGGIGELSAVYYETEAGRGGYFRPDGSSVRRQFLAAPVSYTRISSSYSPARLHPILGVSRPHHGVDYAAPSGTAVWSVGDGKVIYKGWAGGFGRLVKVRHTNGYVSYYAHLSRFAKDLRVGQIVQQRQVIGYVGQSGLATGPHVCFRVARGGRYVNPAALRAPAGEPIPPTQRADFERVRNQLLTTLSPPRLVVTDEAL